MSPFLPEMFELFSRLCQYKYKEERSLQEAEEKIAGLLQVKEKLVNVEVISCKIFLAPIRKYFCPQAEKERLAGDVRRLEEELSIIAVASRTLTACTVIPIIG